LTKTSSYFTVKELKIFLLLIIGVQNIMLWTIIVILLILWLLGLIGGIGGSAVHLILIIVLIVILIQILAGNRAL
jgi:hypothetical protein